jgi:hypothetical protein
MSATQHPQRPFAFEDAMDARKGFRLSGSHLTGREPGSKLIDLAP